MPIYSKTSRKRTTHSASLSRFISNVSKSSRSVHLSVGPPCCVAIWSLNEFFSYSVPLSDSEREREKTYISSTLRGMEAFRSVDKWKSVVAKLLIKRKVQSICWNQTRLEWLPNWNCQSLIDVDALICSWLFAICNPSSRLVPLIWSSCPDKHEWHQPRATTRSNLSNKERAGYWPFLWPPSIHLYPLWSK